MEAGALAEDTLWVGRRRATGARNEEEDSAAMVESDTRVMCG